MTLLLPDFKTSHVQAFLQIIYTGTGFIYHQINLRKLKKMCDIFGFPFENLHAEQINTDVYESPIISQQNLVTIEGLDVLTDIKKESEFVQQTKIVEEIHEDHNNSNKVSEQHIPRSISKQNGRHCKICSKEFSSLKALAFHLSKTHYYRKLKTTYMHLLDFQTKSCTLCGFKIKNIHKPHTFVFHIGTIHKKALKIYNKYHSDVTVHTEVEPEIVNVQSLFDNNKPSHVDDDSAFSKSDLYENFSEEVATPYEEDEITRESLPKKINMQKIKKKRGRKSRGETHECKICFQTFPNPSKFAIHLSASHYRAALRQHYKYLFDEEKMLCKLCSKPMTNFERFIIHIGGKHKKAMEIYNKLGNGMSLNDVINNEDEEIDDDSLIEYDFYEDIPAHEDENPNLSEIQNPSFNFAEIASAPQPPTTNDLDSVKYYKCGKCDESYNQAFHLKEHHKKVHNEETNENISKEHSIISKVQHKDQNERTVYKVCQFKNPNGEICGMTFEKKQNLDVHLKLHSEVESRLNSLKRLFPNIEMNVIKTVFDNNDGNMHIIEDQLYMLNPRKKIIRKKKLNLKKLKIRRGKKKGEVVECKICAKILPNPSLFARHLSIIHYKSDLKERYRNQFDTDQMKCLLCDKSMKNFTCFLNHIGGTHQKALEMYNASGYPEIQVCYDRKFC